MGPLRNEETEKEPLISYDVPIIKDSSAVGVLGIDMSLGVLTDIAQNYRTSTHSHITILDKDGSYIVHPDSNRLLYMNGPARLKDNDDPSVEWDLTNFASTPVASGFYLIHVKDNTSGGERTIKFFGAMRQIDLNTF